MRFQKPSESDQSDFIFQMLFGEREGSIRGCVNLAYLDLCRTLHRFAKHPNAEELREAAHEELCAIISELKDRADSFDQDVFDQWHELSCSRLRRIYEDDGFPGFTIGHSQKWINMAIKYVFVMGEQRVPGFERIYCLGHAPIDNVMMERLSKHKPSRKIGVWSRLNDYGKYLEYQRWIRKHFAGSAPLAVEFHLYRKAERCSVECSQA